MDKQNYNNVPFVGYIQGGKIYTAAGQQVGCTSEEYNKAVEIAKGYEQVLIDKGILSKPKTAEEINLELQNTLKETQSMMAGMADTIKSLNDEIKKMKEGKDEQGYNPESGTKVCGTGNSPEIE